MTSESSKPVDLGSSEGLGHTRGPWKRTGLRIVKVTEIPGGGRKTEFIGEVYRGGGKTAAEVACNARGFEALPELLEIVEQLIACHDEPTCPAVAVAQDLVRRIRGA